MTRRFGVRLRRPVLATRPQFLGASLLPVLVGSAWGAAQAAGPSGPWADHAGLLGSQPA